MHFTRPLSFYNSVNIPLGAARYNINSVLVERGPIVVLMTSHAMSRLPARHPQPRSTATKSSYIEGRIYAHQHISSSPSGSRVRAPRVQILKKSLPGVGGPRQ